MAKKCAAFGMTTIYHNRKPLSTEQAAGAEYVGFEELLARSDVLSLNLPLNVRFVFPPSPHLASLSRGGTSSLTTSVR